MDNEVSFPFPFPPYDVQKDFMKNLYNVLEAGKIGIFESPTGTGKSLSIICGSLKWLKDFQEYKKNYLKNVINEEVRDSDNDWFNDFLKEQEKRHKVLDAKKEFEFILAHETRIKNIRSKKVLKKGGILIPDEKVRNTKRMKYDNADDDMQDILEEDFAIENSENDEEEANEEKEDKPNVLKVYFASRTHSQLTQFVGEIKRSPFGENVTVTTLGSRANLCINDSVLKLKNVSLINEHCIELQRKKTKNKKCCPFIKNLSDAEETILSSVKDIEDIVQASRELKSCPYYASRSTIPDVELVVLPYNILLHKPTREAYGIVLKDNVVIIDEAHNLVEAVNNMYSSEITGLCLQQSLWQLEAYYRTYCSRFSHKNLKFIKILLSVLKLLIAYLKDSLPMNNEPVSKILSCNDFIISAAIGNVNFFEIVEFIDSSLIGHKVHGFTAARVAKGITPLDDLKKPKPCEKKSSTASFLSQIKNKKENKNIEVSVENKTNNNISYKPSAFFTFIEFLKTLTFPTEDGRVLCCKASTMQKSFLKFLHLNPSSHFQDILDNARSIILAGGTMQPVSEFTDLFLNSGVLEERISHFSCGHVIPPENLLALGIGAGPCGNVLDFTFKSRRLPETIKELGSVLTNLCNAVQGGIVCFFPSYDYEDFIFSELDKMKVLDSIKKKKKVFREPKLSSGVDHVLSEYAKTINLSKNKNSSETCSGAILFSIVGGKMSEGINFADDLGRCVVMVGLPYPNKFSVELKEKMKYLNEKAAIKSIKNAGDVYYNNLCMKAVNQSIGRAIRHRNDFATIVLLDYRYKTSVVKDSLPGWILKSFSFSEKFGPAFFALRKFYNMKNR